MPPTPSPLHRTTYVYKQCGGTSIEADVIGAAPGAPRPCIVWIHGGGLMFGWRKSSPRASLIEALIERGFVIVSIDHRLAPETRLPEIVEDVRDAWSRVHAFGASHLGVDPTRIAVAGASSSQAHRRRRRIVVAGASSSQAHRHRRRIVGSVSRAAGWLFAILVHGETDTDVPHEESARLAVRFAETGVRHRFISLNCIGHGFAHASAEEIQKIEEEVADFLAAALA